MKCEVCGNDYDKAFTVELGGERHVFDSFECAIHAIAPTCAHCGCHVVGHGVEQDGSIYCCAHCAHQSGANELKDRHDGEAEARVTEASLESFPASDAPAWGAGAGMIAHAERPALARCSQHRSLNGPGADAIGREYSRLYETDIMTPAKLSRYQSMLEVLHERVGGEVSYVVASIHEDVNVKENVSSAPVHLADVAGDSVDADVKVLQNERGILDEINAALSRIDEGAFGRCADCGAAISEQRLNAIPYTARRAQCAKAASGGA